MPVLKKNNPLMAVFLPEDPIRPGLTWKFRTEEDRFLTSLHWENDVKAILCAAYCAWIPSSMEDLAEASKIIEGIDNNILIAYTVWSYAKGAGRRIVNESIKAGIAQRPTVNRVLTLSPATDMARSFHLGNGAFVYSTNVGNGHVNYEYPMEKIKW